MKKSLMIAALMGGMLFTAGAQTQKANNQAKQEMTVEQQAERHIAKYEAELGLNATQRTQVKGYLVERMNAIKPLREKAQAAATREERKTYNDQIKIHETQFDAKVKAVLTPDQYTKLKAKEAQLKTAKSQKQGNK